jgi:hypothetical protein
MMIIPSVFIALTYACLLSSVLILLDAGLDESLADIALSNGVIEREIRAGFL